jgi:CrcB protein
MSLPTDKLLWVMVGGGLGSGARYLVAIASVGWLGPALPWGTFAVNAVGSLLLGAILARELGSENVRLFLTTGIMGGFTTYSTFNHETLRMLQAGNYRTAALYAGTTFVFCLIAGAAGWWLGRV